MPLQTQLIEILLWQGLDQKTDAKSTKEGSLQVAANVEADKLGALNKRRGYQKVNMDTTIEASTVDSIFVQLATFRDELLVFGYDHLYAVASKDNNLAGGIGIVERGLIPRGTSERKTITTGRIGRVTFGE